MSYIYSVLLTSQNTTLETIKLFELKDSLGVGGIDLLTRPIAKQFVPTAVETVKSAAGKAWSVCFDFEGIGTSDTSFIDQLIVVSVLEEMKKGKMPRTGLFLKHLGPSTADNVRSVFRDKRLPIIVQTETSGFELFGHLEDNLKKTLALLMKKKTLKAADLVRQFSIGVASMKLMSLFKLSLALRTEEISPKGREYTYNALF